MGDIAEVHAELLEHMIQKYMEAAGKVARIMARSDAANRDERARVRRDALLRRAWKYPDMTRDGLRRVSSRFDSVYSMAIADQIQGDPGLS